MRQIVLSITICVMCLDGLSQSRNRGSAGAALTRSDDIAVKDAPIPEDFVIGPEDELDINVWKEPDLNRKVAVRSDGKISIPLLNDIQAAGLTTKQLQEQIRAGYSRFVVEPLISVVVLGIKSQNVYLLGSVKSPGVYPLVGPMTVVELIARAGGFGEFAKSKEILIMRLQKEKGTPIRFRFNYKTFVNGQNYEQNIQLRSGDKVFVP